MLNNPRLEGSLSRTLSFSIDVQNTKSVLLSLEFLKISVYRTAIIGLCITILVVSILAEYLYGTIEQVIIW